MIRKLIIFLSLIFLFFVSLKEVKALDIKVNENIIKTLFSTSTPIPTPTSLPTPEPTLTFTPKPQLTPSLTPPASSPFSSPTEIPTSIPENTLVSTNNIWQLTTIALIAAILGGGAVFLFTRRKATK